MKVTLPVFFLAGLLGAFCVGAMVHAVCAPLPLGTSIWIDAAKVSPGYLLVSPYYGATNFSGSGEINLLNSRGEVAHQWKTQYTTLISYLQPNGHVFAAMTPPIDPHAYPSGGSTGIIQELDWDGAVLWEYADHQMTHDFEVLPEGKVAYIRWHLSKPDFALKVLGGMDVASSSVWTNELVIVNRDKKIEWTWRPDDHLDPRDFVLSPLVPRTDWAHINSIRYLAENPVTHKPAFLISARDISTVFIVDIETGKVLWQSPKGLMSLQHDATLTEDGTVLLFDNGFLRNIPKPLLISAVEEINPVTQKVVWGFTGGSEVLEKAQFASSIMSGAQRLPNKNTLITLSMANKIIEVDPTGNIVWSYTNDWRDEEGRMRVIFKARKYEGGEWQNRLSGLPSMRSLMCPR